MSEPSGREYVDLRVMLVGSDEYAVSVFKGVAASLGVHGIAAYASAKAALANIRLSGPPDILFVMFLHDDSKAESFQLCRFVRDRGAFPYPFTPIVAVMEHATVTAVTAVRDAGADEFLACPYSPRSLAERIGSIVHDRRGFVDIPGYFGPDRRRGAMARWLGADRRSDPSTLIDPVTEQVYIG